jgi:hypothetical protein
MWTEKLLVDGNSSPIACPCGPKTLLRSRWCPVSASDVAVLPLSRPLIGLSLITIMLSSSSFATFPGDEKTSAVGKTADPSLPSVRRFFHDATSRVKKKINVISDGRVMNTHVAKLSKRSIAHSAAKLASSLILHVVKLDAMDANALAAVVELFVVGDENRPLMATNPTRPPQRITHNAAQLHAEHPEQLHRELTTSSPEAALLAAWRRKRRLMVTSGRSEQVVILC